MTVRSTLMVDAFFKCVRGTDFVRWVRVVVAPGFYEYGQMVRCSPHPCFMPR